MAFIAGAAIIGGTAALGGAIIGANAAGSAADKQTAAANQANQLQWQMYQQQRADQEPWRQAGISALYGPGGLFRRKGGGVGGIAMTDPSGKKEAFLQSKMAPIEQLAASMPGRLGDQIRNDYRSRYEQEWASSPESQATVAADQYELDPEMTRSFTAADFQEDPGYQFRMQEGQKALERSAAARGGLQSGGTLKAISRYGQDFASNEYQNAYNRFNNDRTNRFNRLSALAGVGQTANSQVASAGSNYANNYGQNTMGAANAAGAAGIAQANMYNNTLSGLGNTWMQYQLMNKYAGGK